MRLFQLLLLLLLMSSVISAQSEGDYNFWLKAPSSYHPLKRIRLVELKDTSIVFFSKTELIELPVSKIIRIEARRKKQIERGFFKGLIGGAAIGTLIAIIDGAPKDDCFFCLNKTDKIKIYSLSLGIGGGFGHAFASSFRIKIPINGKNSNYQREKIHLRDLIKGVGNK